MDTTVDITKNGGVFDTIKNNKPLVGLVVVLVLVVIACIIFRKESFRPDNVRGWDVEKAANNFMKYQQKVKQKIMDDRVKNVEFY